MSEPVLKIENCVDLRTQRTTKNPNLSKRNRERREMSRAKGLCVKCHCEPTGKKALCQSCRKANQRASERSVINKYGLPMPFQLMTKEEMMRANIDILF